MLFRGPHRRIWLGALSRIGSILLLLIFLGPPGLGGCAHAPRSARTHVVKKGENLYRIAKRYGVSVESIKHANGIRDVTSIPVGTRLRIPGGLEDGSAGETPVQLTREQSSHLFSWPVKGVLTSRFGRRNGRPHEGIDISVKDGMIVVAAAPGRVIFSGKGDGYGNMVVIKHEGNFTTVYAHNSRNLVAKGKFVERGDRIAEAGHTGNVRGNGPVVHFEIRIRNKPVDPLGYLP